MDEQYQSWRTLSLNLLDIGRAIAEIEQDFRHIRATAAVSDKQAAGYVGSSLRSARRLVRALESLSHGTQHKEATK